MFILFLKESCFSGLHTHTDIHKQEMCDIDWNGPEELRDHITNGNY